MRPAINKIEINNDKNFLFGLQILHIWLDF